MERKYMAIKGLTLKESMNKNVQAIMPQEDEKKSLRANLSHILKHWIQRKMNQKSIKKILSLVS